MKDINDAILWYYGNIHLIIILSIVLLLLGKNHWYKDWIFNVIFTIEKYMGCYGDFWMIICLYLMKNDFNAEKR